MTRAELDRAVEAAKVFIWRAERIQWHKVGPRDYPDSHVETAATKRASLDLTRALARMRRP